MKINWKGKGIFTIRLRSHSHVVPHAHAVNRSATAFEPTPVQQLHPDCAHELKLRPGINEGIHAETWKEAQKNEVAQHYLASGEIEVIAELS